MSIIKRWLYYFAM